MVGDPAKLSATAFAASLTVTTLTDVPDEPTLGQRIDEATLCLNPARAVLDVKQLDTHRPILRLLVRRKSASHLTT
jgi:hypothetical protein